jgi:hypothetical protein
MICHLKDRPGWILFCTLLCLMVSNGCSRQGAAPDPPAGYSLGMTNGIIIFRHWKDGPAFMICADVVGGHSSQGSQSQSGPSGHSYTDKGRISAPDGRRFDWQAQTSDGRSIRFLLDGKEYDLSKGSLFLVKTKEGKTEVEQLSKDLSAVQADSKSVEEFARKDAAVSKLLGIKTD